MDRCGKKFNTSKSSKNVKNRLGKSVIKKI